MLMLTPTRLLALVLQPGAMGVYGMCLGVKAVERLTA
ncbi:hypothetical protein HaLaN_10720 [Haematococcus lacustris]|uniref:Uncharacterized protein n=1 Tax=Haematococcus lacustris TaxID=44745 RepID=A0A699Z5R7_HAELA|nr:hypothetical protein HaLaN_10720 [Haematococcus lacustris]